MQNSLSYLLRGHGYAVTVAENGGEALDILFDHAGTVKPIDLILLDFQLPEMSAMEFLERLSEEDNALPVVMITEHVNPQMTAKAKARGCMDILAQPFEAEEALRCLKSVLLDG
jgi:CheY-like chemotaxis protein